jgi:uncharacterized membrane protein
METDFFAGMLVPPFGPSPDWAESLAENLLQPHFPISTWEALGRRYRRNYYLIFFILMLAWMARVALLPDAISTIPELLERAAIDIPGVWVLGFGALYNLFWLVASHHWSARQRRVLPRYLAGYDHIGQAPEGGRWKAWFGTAASAGS